MNSEVGLNSTLDSSKYIISPNEILGFSWQIAKGMTYLSDMKVSCLFVIIVIYFRNRS